MNARYSEWLRAASMGLGALAVLGGALGILWPEFLRRSIGPLPPRNIEHALNVGSVGYGLLLLLPIRTLARNLWLVTILILLALLFAVGVYHVTVLYARDFIAMGVVVRLIPAAVVLLLVVRCRVQPDLPQRLDNLSPPADGHER